MLKNSIKKLILPLFKTLNGINKIFYKNKHKIVLYSNLGFKDNVKALYDYLIENNYNVDYEIVCSINDYKEYKKNKIDNVRFTSNKKGVFHFLTSKYFFYSFGKYPIKPSKKQMVINIWHGTPLKKIGNLENGKEHIDYNFFSYVLATSDIFANVMKDAFTCNTNQVIICGHPRNDMLFKYNDTMFESRDKLILWLPTHRNHNIADGVDKDNSGIPIFYNHNTMSKLNDYLKELNIQLVIKLHLRQGYDESEYKQYEHINIWTDEDFSNNDINLYKFLGNADALVTDYSSVYFDYLLLNRPIAFTINDIERYSDERGFVFANPERYMPGQKIKSEDQFYGFLTNVSEGNDEYKTERDKINKLVNYYTDGKNCKRVLDTVGIKKSFDAE